MNNAPSRPIAGDAATESAGPDDAEDRPPSPLAVDVVDPGRRLPTVQIRELAGRIARAAARAGWRGEARFRLVGDEEMAAAHRTHLGDPDTTDVLTFADAAPAGTLDVDVLLGVDEARRRAGGDPLDELTLYAVHAMLHAAGLDDRDPDEAAAMHRREDELLEAIGVGRVYEAGVRRAAAGRASAEPKRADSGASRG